jgi:hypothetical protein
MRFACWITKATNTHSEYLIVSFNASEEGNDFWCVLWQWETSKYTFADKIWHNFSLSMKLCCFEILPCSRSEGRQFVIYWSQVKVFFVFCSHQTGVFVRKQTVLWKEYCMTCCNNCTESIVNFRMSFAVTLCASTLFSSGHVKSTTIPGPVLTKRTKTEQKYWQSP